MKIDQLLDELQRDLAWRKQEISQMMMILNSAECKDVVTKSMVLLLYAHWEGYIKKSCKYYLKYVSEKRIKIKNLTLNFKAIVLKKHALQCIEQASSMTLEKEYAFINKHAKMEEKDFNIKIDVNNEFDSAIIDTEKNLSSKVLKNINNIVGIKYNSAMEMRAQYIDSVLLKNRNAIGHGSLVEISDEETLTYDKLVELKEFIFIMLDYYTEVFTDYVEKEFYLQDKSEERTQYEEQKDIDLQGKFKSLNDCLKK